MTLTPEQVLERNKEVEHMLDTILNRMRLMQNGDIENEFRSKKLLNKWFLELAGVSAFSPNEWTLQQ